MRATLLLLLVLLAAPAQAQVLRVGLGFDPNVLDPAQSGSFVERTIFSALCDKLLDVAPDLSFRPELATRWAWSDEGRTLTLTIREDGRFHDGTALDAEAVRVNLERYRNARESRRRAELRPVTAVEAPDARTVVIRLSEPYAPLLSVLSDRAGMILSPTALARLGERIRDEPVCSGPFRLTRRVAQERIELERFAQHWNAANIHVERLIFLPITDNTVRLLNLRAGQLDLIERVGPSDVADAQRDRRLQMVEATAIAYQTLTINVAAGALRDPRVREAFERSIDRAVINQVALEGLFVPNNQVEAPGAPYHFADLAPPPRDPARARALLREAGHDRFAFRLFVTNGPVEQQVGQILQAMAQEGGFDIRIQSMESAAMVAATQRGDYDVALAIWSGRADPDGNSAVWFASDGFLNWGRYRSEAMDRALAAARMTNEPAARRALYREVAQAYLTDRPHIVLYHHRWFWAMRAGMSGFEANPDGVLRFAGIRLPR